MNRRGFLKALAGAVATATAGIQWGETTADGFARVHDPVRASKVLEARHLYWFDASHGMFAHRIDVMLGRAQWGVDCLTMSEKLDAERELAPCLAQLEAALTAEAGDCDVRIGRIFTFSYEQWESDPTARAQWRGIG